jgi:5'-nucleotidase
VGATNAGGAEYLATHVKNLEQANRNTIVVAAGDLIGATPLLSAAFHDEPTIEAMNQIGLDLSSVGTTSSTKAQPSCCACRTAVAIP